MIDLSIGVQSDPPVLGNAKSSLWIGLKVIQSRRNLESDCVEKI